MPTLQTGNSKFDFGLCWRLWLLNRAEVCWFWWFENSMSWINVHLFFDFRLFSYHGFSFSRFSFYCLFYRCARSIFNCKWTLCLRQLRQHSLQLPHFHLSKPHLMVFFPELQFGHSDLIMVLENNTLHFSDAFIMLIFFQLFMLIHILYLSLQFTYFLR